jgi:hypothetical protein
VTSGYNWLPAGVVLTHGSLTGTVNDAGGNVIGVAPGFADAAGEDFTLAAGSPGLDGAGPLPAQTTAHPLDAVYLPDRRTDPRTGTPRDLGAFWRGGGPAPAAAPPPPPPDVTLSSCGGCSAGGSGALAWVLLLAAVRRGRRLGRFTPPSPCLSPRERGERSEGRKHLRKRAGGIDGSGDRGT